jgi:hypothetical protein
MLPLLVDNLNAKFAATSLLQTACQGTLVKQPFPGGDRRELMNQLSSVTPYRFAKCIGTSFHAGFFKYKQR